MFRLQLVCRESLFSQYNYISFMKQCALWLPCEICSEQCESVRQSLMPNMREMATVYKLTAIHNTNLDLETAGTKEVCLLSLSPSLILLPGRWVMPFVLPVLM